MDKAYPNCYNRKGVMSKNIVVMSDGTGQEGGKGHDTNVYKLFRMLEDRTDKQVVFYDEGLGTDRRKISGNAFGAGFSKNLMQCYQFIFDNYNAGDRIYLFGFSRWAATVRSLASFIHYFGILPKSRPELIKKAYNLYRQGQDEVGSAIFNQAYKVYKMGLDRDEWEDVLNKEAKKFIHEHPNQWATIEFLGVWDTVPALGIVALAGLNSFLGKILKYSFHNYKLHPSVKNAYHAVAVDDDRLWFHPSLWTEKTREEQIVEQVWFSGAHTDVGGGFNEPGLSDISLEWMVEKAVSHGLRIFLGSRKYWNFVVAPDPTDLYHPARKGFGKVFKEGKRNDVWKNQGAWATFGRPVIHRSVLERHLRSKSTGDEHDDKNPWILEQVSKSSNFYEAKDFKSFLSQKFYETIKYEWKRYDWEKDQQQTKRFDEWIKTSDYKEYFDTYEWHYHKVYMEDGYKKHSKDAWKAKEQPETRNAWMQKNPFTYDKDLDPDWLDSYPVYQAWLKEHTMLHDRQTYFVEPFKELVLEKKKDFKCYSPTGSAGEKIPESDAAILSLRDYDEVKLKNIMKSEDGSPIMPIEEKEVTNLFRKSRMVVKLNTTDVKDDIDRINSENNGLINRGKLENEKKHDRIVYDLSRWTERDEAYTALFSKKEEETE
jgi:hypothetical protein